jgi:hypothetical protein
VKSLATALFSNRESKSYPSCEAGHSDQKWAPPLCNPLFAVWAKSLQGLVSRSGTMLAVTGRSLDSPESGRRKSSVGTFFFPLIHGSALYPADMSSRVRWVAPPTTARSVPHASTSFAKTFSSRLPQQLAPPLFLEPRLTCLKQECSSNRLHILPLAFADSKGLIFCSQASIANGVKSISTCCRLSGTRRRYWGTPGDGCRETMNRLSSMKSRLRLCRHPQNPERWARPALPTQKIHNFIALGTLPKGTWCAGGFQNSEMGRRIRNHGVLRSINTLLTQTAPRSNFTTQA